MNILMVSPEYSPLLKVGGLADAVSGLTQALRSLGHDVRVLLPGYKFLPGGAVRYRCDLPIANFELCCWRSGEDSYFYAVQHPIISSCKEIYGGYTPVWNSENFAISLLLGQAALAASQRDVDGWSADIIHLHDWSTGLVPQLWEHYPEVVKKPVLLTIHNLDYQGVFPFIPDFHGMIEMPEFNLANLLYDNQINLLAAAIRGSDQVVTVSPGYASELMNSDKPEQLSQPLHEHQPIKGLLNGVDYQCWNPATDHYLAPDNYDVNSIAVKQLHKERLCSKLSLSVAESVPLFVMVARLCRQKGFDLLSDLKRSPLIEPLSNKRLQLIILGKGEEKYVRNLHQLTEIFAGFRFLNTFSEEICHKMHAAADFFLIPSESEPCGLNQLYSFSYGSLPVARATGGLRDTINDEEDGFLYHEQSSAAIASCIDRALQIYDNKEELAKRRRCAMNRRFDWRDTADKYCDLYTEMLTAATNGCC